MHRAWGVADIADLRFEIAVAVEDLDALIAGIRDIDIALRVDGNGSNAVELPVFGSGLPPRLQELSVLVELGDAVVVANAVGNVNVAGTVPRDIRRAAERRTLRTGTRACTPPAGTASRGRTPAAAVAPPGAAGAAARRRLWRRARGFCCTRGWRHCRHGAAVGRRSTWSGRTYADSLRLSAKHELHVAVRIELDDLVGTDVNRPDVVLWINPQTLRRIEPVEILAQSLSRTSRSSVNSKSLDPA